MSSAEFLLKLALALKKDAAAVPALASEGESVGNLLARDLAGAGTKAVRGEIANIGRLNAPRSQAFAARSFKTPLPQAKPVEPVAGNTAAFHNSQGPGSLPPVPAPVAKPVNDISTTQAFMNSRRGPGRPLTPPPAPVAMPAVPPSMGKTSSASVLHHLLGKTKTAANIGMGGALSTLGRDVIPAAQRAPGLSAAIGRLGNRMLPNKALATPAPAAPGLMSKINPKVAIPVAAGVAGAGVAGAGLGAAAMNAHDAGNMPQSDLGAGAMHAGDAVSSAAGRVGNAVSGLAGQAGEYFKGLGSNPMGWMQGHPIGTAVGAVGALGLLYSLLHRSRRHDNDE